MSEAKKALSIAMLVGVGVLVVCLSRSSIGDDLAGGKLPVPSAKVRAEKSSQIDRLLGVGTLTTSGAKHEMLQKLFRISDESDSDPDAKFTLLNMARKLAEDLGDIDLAFKSIDGLAKTFDFDADQLRAMAVRNSLTKGVDRIAHRDQIRAIGFAEIQRLSGEGKLSKAIELNQLLRDEVDFFAESKLAMVLESQASVLRERLENRDAYEKARQTLANSPDDQEANAIVGIHYLVDRLDSQSASEYIEQANRPDLRALCNLLLAESSSATNDLKVGDAWREASLDFAGHRQSVALRQSALAYQRAEKNLTGLDQVRAKKELQQLLNSGVSLAATGDSIGMPMPALGSETKDSMPVLHEGIVSCRWMGKRAINIMPLIQPTIHSVRGDWAVSDSKLISPNSKMARIRLPVVPPDEYELHFNVETKSVFMFVIKFPTSGGRRCAAIFGSPNRAPVNGFEFIDNKPWNSNVSTVKTSILKPNQSHAVRLVVRRGRLEAFVDGKVALKFEGDDSRITSTHHWEGPDETTFLLGSDQSPVVYSDIRLVSLVDADDLQQRPYPARTGQTAEWYRKAAFDLPLILRKYRKVNLDQYPEMAFRTHFGLIGKGGLTAPPKGAPTQAKISKKPYKTGLWMHTKDNGSAWVSYHLGGRYRTFRTLTGVYGTSTKKLKGRLTFSVHGDGKVLASRPAVNTRNDWKPLEADVTGVQTLVLKVDCAGNSSYGAGFWPGASLEK